MASRPTGAPPPESDIRVCYAGDRRALSPATVRRAVLAVLNGEGAGEVHVTVTFLSSAKMRALNRRFVEHSQSRFHAISEHAHGGFGGLRFRARITEKL